MSFEILEHSLVAILINRNERIATLAKELEEKHKIKN